MSLSKDECLIACEALVFNAKSKFDEAELLAKNDSFGTASSLMITSMEESIKALVLSLDACGFQFRSKVNGIKTIFSQHGLRYHFALILSLVSVFYKDFKKFNELIIANYNFANYRLDSTKIIRWFRIKIHTIQNEIEWFEKIASHRENGLYIDIQSDMIDPRNISSHEYSVVAQRVKRTQILVDYMVTIAQEEESLIRFKDIQKQFFSEKWYSKIGEIAIQVNKNKGPKFEVIKDFFNEIEEMFKDDEYNQEFKKNVASLNRSLEERNGNPSKLDDKL